MFKKLVSNLPFSPGLVGQMGFYLKRLRQEEFMRRIGMIFTAMSVAVQMISMAIPPSQAQASSTNNLIYETVVSKDHFLQVWDSGDTNGNKDIDDIFLYYGITKKDVQDSILTTMNSTDKFDGYETWTMGRKAFGKPREFKKTIPTNEGSDTTFYVRPWAAAWGTYSTQVLKGSTISGQKFAIIMDCGNLVVAIEDPVEIKPLIGDFATTCEALTGWAYDPRLPNSAVKIAVNVDGTRVLQSVADQQNKTANNLGYAGNHGFTFAIPEYLLDGNDHTVAVIAFEDVQARGISEGDVVLSSSNNTQVIKANCKTPVEVMICRPGVGIIPVEEKDILPTDYRDLSMCSRMEICVNDKLIPIDKWQYNGESLTCPIIKVCRDGVIVPITSDKKLSTDLEESACDEIKVCLGQTLTVIQKKDFNSSIHKYPTLDAFGSPVCDIASPKFALSKKAFNFTQNIDATKTLARPGDHIVYELITANTGNLDGKLNIEEDLEDILQYSTLVDKGGGIFNEETKFLIWTNVEIKAGANVTHAFEVRIKDSLPQTATNQGNRASYDFEMTNVYGNAISVKLPKPVSKQVEEFTGSLPNTGPAETGFFLSLFVLSVFFFYFRNRLVTKELLMLRKDFRGA